MDPKNERVQKFLPILKEGKKKVWIDSDVELFYKGIEMYGLDWWKITKLVGTKTKMQV